MGSNLALDVAGRGYTVAVFNRAATTTEKFLASPEKYLTPPKFSCIIHRVSGFQANQLLMPSLIAFCRRFSFMPEPFWFSENVNPNPDARIEIARLKNRFFNAHQYNSPLNSGLSKFFGASFRFTNIFFYLFQPSGIRLSSEKTAS